MKSINRLSVLFLAFAYLFCLTSCDSGQSPIGKICTGEFKIIGVHVFSVEEEPISFDQVTVKNLETNRVIAVCDGAFENCENGVPVGYPEEGFYHVFHDGVKDEIAGEKSKIQIEGSNEKISFSEEFQIGYNGCHVFKAAGPDTVFVEVNE